MASIAAGLIVFHQLWLIVSGNYSWLNWLTAVLGAAGFSGSILRPALPLHVPSLLPRPLAFDMVIYFIAVGTVVFSVQPVKNLFSRNQIMNYSYNRFHLVNTYGAFGSVGRERYEIVMEGTVDRVLTPATEWREYGFQREAG